MRKCTAAFQENFSSILEVFAVECGSALNLSVAIRPVIYRKVAILSVLYRKVVILPEYTEKFLFAL
jgi:hypothetical protein